MADVHAQAALVAERVLRSHFGDCVGKVGAALLARGRLSVPQLRRLVPSLDVRTIHRCLVVLIQHNCCRHSDVTVAARATGAEPANEAPEPDRLHYELILDEILARLRFGKFIATVAQMSGGAHTPDNPAMQVVMVQHVLEHGKVSVGALLDFQATRLGRTADGEERRRWGAMVEELVEKHHLLALALPKDVVIDLDFEQDLQDQHFKEHKSGGIPPKDLKNWKAERADKRQQRDFDFEDPDGDEYIYRHKKHRALHSTDTSDDSGCSLSRNLELRVSYERFYIRWRNDLVTTAVRDRHGPQAALLVRTLLAVSYGKMKSSREPFSPGVRVMDIHIGMLPLRFRDPSAQGHSDAVKNLKAQLRHAFDVEASIDSHDKHDGSASGPKRKWEPTKLSTSDCVNELCAIIARRYDTGVDKTSPPQAWLRRVDVSSEQGWQVNFAAVLGSLRRSLLEGVIRNMCTTDEYANEARDKDEEREAMVQARLDTRLATGQHAMRVFNLLERHGKLEEKTLAKMAMIQPKDCRNVLGRLSEAGVLEMHEVVRSKTDKARSIFLWFVDSERWTATLLSLAYQTLGNLEARRDHEEARTRDVREKAKREDIRAGRAELEIQEAKAVQSLKDRLTFINASETRIDADRFILELPGVV